MGKLMKIMRIVIVEIIFVLALTFILGGLYAKSIIKSLNTSIMLDGVADNINSYVQSNSQFPPNLESLGYKSKSNGHSIRSSYAHTTIYGLVC